MGDAFQYSFSVDSILTLPDDAPGDLMVDGHPPLAVSIISKEGLTVTLSVSVDLGSFVPNARLQSDLTMLMRRLIERIAECGETPNPAGDLLLGEAEPRQYAGGPTQEHNLNPQQLAALESSLTSDLTFIWGPPGTGKTHAIGAIAAELHEQGKPLLLVSHTNVAVDQALLRIARLLGEKATNGKVIRVGSPKDERLRRDHEELLLETQVNRRSAQLAQKRTALEEERNAKAEESKRVQRLIAIHEWLPEAASDVAAMQRSLVEMVRVRQELDNLEKRQRILLRDSPKWQRRAKEAHRALTLTQEAAVAQSELEASRVADQKLTTSLRAAERTQRRAHGLLQKLEEIEPFRLEVAKMPPRQEAEQVLHEWETQVGQSQNALQEVEQKLEQAQALYDEVKPLSPIKRAWRRLPAPEKLEERLHDLRTRRDAAGSELEQNERDMEETRSVVARIKELEGKLGDHESLPTLSQQRETVADADSRLEDLQRRQSGIRGTQERREELLRGARTQLERFRATHRVTPEKLLKRAQAQTNELDALRGKRDEVQRSLGERSASLGDLLRERVAVVRAWGLTTASTSSHEEMLEAIKAACALAKNEIRETNIDRLRAHHVALNSRLREITTEVAGIDEELKRVEETVISEATIVATTLTRAYLRESIQKRRFDTVILDEASMAPIPALWLVARLAERGIVVVGDFRQLPPIVQSEHELAKRWLGRDIFLASGVQTAHEEGRGPAHFVPLRRQYRMHPSISAIANAISYPDNKLENDKGVTETARADSEDEPFNHWYNWEWGYDKPVLLVDTESAGAWVTSVSRGTSASRLNFLSATICVDLAQLLLNDARSQPHPEDPRRVLIASPYYPHARLLSILIEEQGLSEEAVAGTVHSFQGSQADVVILDLVVDEPHFRAHLFTPAFDAELRRLLNVAVTRARRRLIIVGDFAWCCSNGRKAFVGREFLPLLLGAHPRVDAIEIVPSNVAARAAELQQVVLAGTETLDAPRVIATQDQFYRYLLRDLEDAQRRIVFYSGWITSNRLATLEPQIKAAIAREVTVYVVTKTHGERKRGEIANYRQMENSLASWGVVVIHKRKMHEKLVFVDNDIVWVGSLNPLSHSDTQEVMERRRSKALVEEYTRCLRVSDLVGGYADGPPQCPLCGRNLVAAEGGGRKGEPFFWRCDFEDCRYTRGVDDPLPVDGLLVCQNCGGGLEFGYWGDRPHWRCKENPRHRQRIFRTHLRLPRMADLIPKKELRKLCAALKMDVPRPSIDRRGQLQMELPPPASRQSPPAGVTRSREEKTSPLARREEQVLKAQKDKQALGTDEPGNSREQSDGQPASCECQSLDGSRLTAEVPDADPKSQARLARAVQYAKAQTRLQDLRSPDLQRAIVLALLDCPRSSCTLDSLPRRVFEKLEYEATEDDRAAFGKALRRSLRVLKRRGIVQEYGQRNSRVRLVRKSQEC